MWHRDKQLSKDVLLGVARLPLSDIIVAEKTKIMVSCWLEESCKAQGLTRSKDSNLPAQLQTFARVMKCWSKNVKLTRF